MADPLVAGRFELLDVVGSGAFGLVWRAYDWKHRKLVAVKVFASRGSQPELIHRFVQEQGFRLSHPNVLAPLDFFSDSQQAALVMDLAAGGSLEELLSRGRPTLSASVAMLGQLLEGIAYVHGEGIIHRDIKPANVLLDTDERGRVRVRLSDFGHALPTGGPRFTAPADVVGTPGYIAPELYALRDASTRSDIYSVGAVAYQLLTGNEPAAPLHSFAATDPAVPETLRTWLTAVTQPEPGDRPSTAEQALAHLRTVTSGLRVLTPRAEPRLAPPPRPRHLRRKRRRQALAALTVVVLGATAVAAQSLARQSVAKSTTAAKLALMASNGQALARNGNLDTGLLLTSQAYLRSATPEVRDAALQTLSQRPPGLIRFLTVTAGPINDLAVSSSNTLVAAAGGSIALFDLVAGRALRVPAFADAIGVTFSADDRHLVVTTESHGVSITNVGSDRVSWHSRSHHLKGAPSRNHLLGSEVGINARGSTLAQSYEHSTWLTDLASGRTKEIPQVRKYSDGYSSSYLTAMSPGGDQLAAAEEDGRLMLFDTRSPKPPLILWPKGGVQHNKLRYVTIQGVDYLVDLVGRAGAFMWDMAGHLVRRVTFPEQARRPYPIDVSDDLGSALLVFPDRQPFEYQVLDTATHKTITLGGLPDPPLARATTPVASRTGAHARLLSHGHVVIASGGSIVEYDSNVAGGIPSGLFEPVPIPGKLVTLAPSGLRGLALKGNRAVVFDTSRGQTLNSIPIPPGLAVKTDTTHFSPDAKQLALTLERVAHVERVALQLWDLQPLRLLTQRKLPCPRLSSAYARDGATIITQCATNYSPRPPDSLDVYDARSGRILFHRADGRLVAESPDGRTMVIESTLRDHQQAREVIDLHTGRAAPSRFLRLWWASAERMSLSDDGTTAIFQRSGAVQLYSGSHVRRLPLPVGVRVTDLHYGVSPNGMTAVSIWRPSGVLRLWDLRSRRVIGPAVKVVCQVACTSSDEPNGGVNPPYPFAFDSRSGDLLFVDDNTPANTILRMPITPNRFREVACAISNRDLTPDEEGLEHGVTPIRCRPT